MFSRVQNRNSGYSENLFSQSPRAENSTISSIDGATALKLDESYHLEEQELNNSIYNVENQSAPHNFQQTLAETEPATDDLSSGVSIESASYMENSNLTENESEQSFAHKNDSDEEHSPKLFSEEQNYQSEEITSEIDNQVNNDYGQLFDQDTNEDEDFEIPAFLRKQKF
jgi:hypothetical protein